MDAERDPTKPHSPVAVVIGPLHQYPQPFAVTTGIQIAVQAQFTVSMQFKPLGHRPVNHLSDAVGFCFRSVFGQPSSAGACVCQRLRRWGVYSWMIFPIAADASSVGHVADAASVGNTQKKRFMNTFQTLRNYVLFSIDSRQ